MRYLAQLTPEEQAEDVTYARRLACCGKCTWYGEHMCRACGCYVQLRAAVKEQNCPYENGNKKERRMIHDPAIFYDEVSGNYYTYSTGAICQKSKDLVHWQEIGKVVERPPQESVEWTGSEDIWAPDIVKVGKNIVCTAPIPAGVCASPVFSGSGRPTGRSVRTQRVCA